MATFRSYESRSTDYKTIEKTIVLTTGYDGAKASADLADDLANVDTVVECSTVGATATADLEFLDVSGIDESAPIFGHAFTGDFDSTLGISAASWTFNLVPGESLQLVFDETAKEAFVIYVADTTTVGDVEDLISASAGEFTGPPLCVNASGTRATVLDADAGVYSEALDTALDFCAYFTDGTLTFVFKDGTTDVDDLEGWLADGANSLSGIAVKTSGTGANTFAAADDGTEVSLTGGANVINEAKVSGDNDITLSRSGTEYTLSWYRKSSKVIAAFGIADNVDYRAQIDSTTPGDSTLTFSLVNGSGTEANPTTAFTISVKITLIR